MRTFASIATLVLLASACGGGSDKAAPTTTGPTTTATPATATPTTTAAPTTTVAPTVTAAPTTSPTSTTQVQVDTGYEESLKKFHEAKTLMLSSGDFSPFECAASIVGADRAAEFMTADPTGEELSLLESCFDDFSPQTEQAAPPTTVKRHDGPTSRPNPAPGNGPIDLGPPVDPANPPRIAVNNFVDLAPYISITKLRSAYGHDYTFGDDEHDPTGLSCRSMKHYFEPPCGRGIKFENCCTIWANHQTEVIAMNMHHPFLITCNSKN